MNEMADHDPRRAWDAIYASSAVVPDEPEPGTRAIVSVLRDLAGNGPALELAVGHGRIAIPLAASGVEVDGIDFSTKAIELIRAHPRGDAVNASVGNISDFALGRTYALVYLVFNTISNLTSQDEQPVRVAIRARPHGTHRRHDPRRSMVGVGPLTVHRRQHLGHQRVAPHMSDASPAGDAVERVGGTGSGTR